MSLIIHTILVISCDHPKCKNTISLPSSLLNNRAGLEERLASSGWSAMTSTFNLTLDYSCFNHRITKVFKAIDITLDDSELNCLIKNSNLQKIPK